MDYADWTGRFQVALEFENLRVGLSTFAQTQLRESYGPVAGTQTDIWAARAGILYRILYGLSQGTGITSEHRELLRQYERERGSEDAKLRNQRPSPPRRRSK